MIKFVAYKSGGFAPDVITFDVADGGCSNASPCFEMAEEEWVELGRPDVITVTVEAGDHVEKK